MATVCYGSRGSGKTTFGAVVAEELHKARQRFCAIDLKGDFWGLRASADGRGEGIPVVIFGGDHADVPLEPDAGKHLGELVASLEQSVVLDFEHMSKGKQIRFLGEFFAALYHANREPLLVIADEAQRYAPQRTISPDSAICLGAVEDLVKLGRKHGLGVLLLSQRGAGLNKEVSEICDALVAFRTPGSTDQERVRDWLGANGFAKREELKWWLDQIAEFRNGEAIVASAHPDLKLFARDRMRLRETYDSSATPKVGQKRREPKKLARPELEAIRSKLSEAIERAKENDPRELQRTIKALQARLQKGSLAPGYVAISQSELEEVRERAKAAANQKIKTVEVPVLTDKDVKMYEAARARIAKVLDDSRQEMEGFAKRITAADRIILEKLEKVVLQSRVPVTAPPALPSAQKKRPPYATKVDDPEGKELPPLKRGAVLMLQFLVAYGERGLTRHELGVQVGLPSHGTTFTAYLSTLRTHRYLDESDMLRASATGAALFNAVPPKATSVALFALWGRKLKLGARKMLDHLDGSRPAFVPREDLGEAVGLPYKGTTFTAYLSTLRTNELIEESGNDVRATPALYLGGIQ